MERVSWIQNGSEFRRVEGNVANVESIPVGIYGINFNPMAGWSLERTGDKFIFDYKVYGLQNRFVQHVLKTFRNTKGNLGILLNGVKGTGKSVTAKVLANEFNLPIVIVKSFGEHNDALVEYLASFNFDCIFFMDEFEKTWSDKDSSILQIMDGVYNSKHRRIFLLTTNETYINENLLSRPSRLRYVKEFGNLEREIVEEYLNDNLNDKERIESIIDFVDTLQISTIDILKTIVEDINIHGFDSFIDNKDIFNVKTAEYHYSAFYTSFGSFDEVKSAGYDDLSQFVKHIKIHENLKQPYPYSYDNPEEHQAAVTEYNKARSKTRGIGTRYLDSSKSVKVLRIGDKFGYYEDEEVVKIDLSKRVVITKEIGDGTICYYFIKDINAKPSLYSGYHNYVANPYYD